MELFRLSYGTNKINSLIKLIKLLFRWACILMTATKCMPWVHDIVKRLHVHMEPLSSDESWLNKNGEYFGRWREWLLRNVWSNKSVLNGCCVVVNPLSLYLLCKLLSIHAKLPFIIGSFKSIAIANQEFQVVSHQWLLPKEFCNEWEMTQTFLYVRCRDWWGAFPSQWHMPFSSVASSLLLNSELVLSFWQHRSAMLTTLSRKCSTSRAIKIVIRLHIL